MDSLQDRVVASGATLLVLTASFIACRLYSRFVKIRVSGLDDVLVIFSWVCSVIMIIATIQASGRGLGRDQDEVGYADYTTSLKLQTTASVFYSCGIAAAKASFAVLYLRLLPKYKYRVLNRALCTFLGCQALVEVLVVALGCNPVQKSWDPTIEGTCVNFGVFWWIAFFFNISTDLLLFAQPVPSMWKLQMSVVKRLGLIVMLSLGLIVAAISAVRISYLSKIGTDDSYELANAMIWGEVELCVLIICSCIPSLRQLFKGVSGLTDALELPSGDNLRVYHGENSEAKAVTIGLPGRGHKEYIPTASQELKGATRVQSGAYGNTSRVEALQRVVSNMSQDEMFPHMPTRDGDVIMVTREVLRQESAATGDAKRPKFNVIPAHRFDGGEKASVHGVSKPRPAHHK